MTRLPTGFLLAAAFLAVPSGPGAQSSTPLDFIEVDVVVVDGRGRSIHSLRQDDFIVKDSGKSVAVETFREVSGPSADDPDSARTVVLLLDDTGVPATGTPLICDVQEPAFSASRSFEQAWTDAVSEAALANVAVYSLIPGSAPLRGQGVADSTGGAVLASTYDMGPPIDRILQDASNYYV